MILIGVTGGIASGKTEVSKVFHKNGAIILSGDKIGKEVVEKNRMVLRELTRVFGNEILNKKVKLDRRKLGRIAFASTDAKEKLNQIIHPYLLRELRRRIESLRRDKPSGIVVVDAALIVEWGLQKELNHLVFVHSRRENRIKRLQEQKSYSRREALDRIKSQLPEKAKRKLADFVIKNDRGLVELRKEANQVWKEIAGK
jgi:dephospho-CoA kinase